MERIRFITHNGHRVLLVDCSNCSAAEIANVSDQVFEHVRAEPAGTVLLLADFTNSQLTRENVERIKIAAVRNRRYLRRSAWVITDALSKRLHDSVETFSLREIPVFRTREAALEQLTSDVKEYPIASHA
jgi:hypothetical protein